MTPRAVHRYFARQRVQIFWRPQTKGKNFEGRAVFVPYVEVGEVRRLLRKAVVDGVIYDWTADYEILGNLASGEEEGGVNVRCTLKLLIKTAEGELYPLVRQDVGEGRDLKGAFSDALKRASFHYGIAALLENLSFQMVRVGQNGRPLPEEERRLEAKVEEAYREVLKDLEDASASPVRELGTPTSTVLSTALPLRTDHRPKEETLREEVDLPLPSWEEAGEESSSSPLWEALVKADLEIGKLIDGLTGRERMEGVKLLSQYHWKRGAFSQNNPERKEELRRFLGLKEGTDEPEEVLLQKARSKAQSLYLALKALKGNVPKG